MEKTSKARSFIKKITKSSIKGKNSPINKSIEGSVKSLDAFIKKNKVPFYKRWYRKLKLRFVPKLQRMNRGWSDEDVLDFDNYLSSVIAGGVKELRKTHIGYPSDLAPKEWDTILDKIVESFEFRYSSCYNYTKYTPKEQDLLDEGMSLFVKYYNYLWD